MRETLDYEMLLVQDACDKITYMPNILLLIKQT